MARSWEALTGCALGCSSDTELWASKNASLGNLIGVQVKGMDGLHLPGVKVTILVSDPHRCTTNSSYAQRQRPLCRTSRFDVQVGRKWDFRDGSAYAESFNAFDGRKFAKLRNAVSAPTDEFGVARYAYRVLTGCST
jgi:hypothetical protein